MNKVLSILLVIFSTIALLLERSSCFEIIVVGLLFIIALSIDKIRFKK